MSTIRDYVNAHRKALAAAIEALLVLLLDADTAQAVAAVIGTLAVILIPNDQAAVDRVYHKGTPPAQDGGSGAEPEPYP